MGLTREQVEILENKYITGLFDQMESEVIADIARRVKKTGRYTETAELMAKVMVEHGYSAARIQAEVLRYLRADKEFQMAVAENTKAYKQEIQDIIEETVQKAKEAGKQLIAEAGNMSWNNDLSMWAEHGVDLTKPNALSQLIRAVQIQTVGELRNLTRTMGFRNTVLGRTGVMEAYQREMDLATLKVATGTWSYDQAVNDCVKRLAESGLRSIDYANGRSYQLDTAVRMCVRTGASQLAGRITEMNVESTGVDLVITSQHVGSRPEHVPWQNKVFSYSGKHKKYPDFRKETGYGTAGGLKGVNCTHDFHPFWEGIDKVPPDIKEPDPVMVNGKTYDYYQATQRQRKMERDIRATKREIEAQKAIDGDPEKLEELRARLRRQREEYFDFSNKVDIRAKENRLRVISGTSDLKKTSAWKRSRSTQGEADIGKELEAMISGAKSKVWDGIQPLPIGRIDTDKRETAVKYFGNQIRRSRTEELYIIDKQGNLYYNRGEQDMVSVGTIDLDGCIVLHNHPASNGIVSFGQDDFNLIRDNPGASYRLVNEEYDYAVEVIKQMDHMTYNQAWIGSLEMYEEMAGDDSQHIVMEYLQREGYIKYDRKRIDGKPET